MKRTCIADLAAQEGSEVKISGFLHRTRDLGTITFLVLRDRTGLAQIISKGARVDHPGLVDYLDAFKYGMPDSGGFGFGMARFVQKLLNLSNVKEAELFPRDVQRVRP